MAKIIHNGRIVDDSWTVISSNDAAPTLAAGLCPNSLLPMDDWKENHQTLASAGKTVGVWLAPSDELAPLIPHLAGIPAIGILFPTFTDGRGYSLARLLRKRHGFCGQLRAFGDILRDQVYFLHQCGFDVLCLRKDQDIEDALAALNDYSWSPMVGH